MKRISYLFVTLLFSFLLPSLALAQSIEEWTGLGYRYGGRLLIDATDASGSAVPELSGTFVTTLPSWNTWPNIDSLGYCPANGGHGPFPLDYVQDGGFEQNPGGEACDEDLPILNDLTGEAALIRRGTCEFTSKALNVQDVGALAAVIHNDERVLATPDPDETELVTMAGGVEAESVTIPAVFVSRPLGQALAELVAAGGSAEVTLTVSDSTYNPVTDFGPDGVPCTAELCNGTAATAEPVLLGCPSPVFSPAEGDELAVCQRHQILWGFPSFYEYVRISLLRGGTEALVLAYAARNDGGFMFDLPCDFPTGDDYQIRVSNEAKTFVVSGGTFEIVEQTVDIEEGAQPQEVALRAVYPNPLEATGTIRYGLPEPAEVRVEVLDVLGRRVAVLAEGARAAGWHEAAVSSDEWAPGTYVVRLVAGERVRTRRLTVAR